MHNDHFILNLITHKQKSLFVWTFVIGLNFIINQTAFALNGTALGFGWSSQLLAARISAQACSNFFDAGDYWEGSLIGIQSRESISGLNNKLGGGSIIHVFNFSDQHNCYLLEPYAEGGIGLALFNHNKIYNRRLGSNLLFELKFGAGLRYDKQLDLGFKWVHNSNAYLAKYNDALNIYYIIFTYKY